MLVPAFSFARPPACVRIATLALAALCTMGLAHTARAAPKLGVVVIFDQMGSDTLERHHPLFGPGGFGGLMAKGAARWDVEYDTAATETAPGHATIATGTDPASHGVPLNGWFQDGQYWFSVRDDDAAIVGDTSGRIGASAKVLRVPTLGDTMKAHSYGRSKVVTISIKDRAAILSGGRSADVALFFDKELGRYTTTTAIATALPAWAEPLATSLPQESMTKGTWTPLQTPAKLKDRLPRDDVEGEGKGFGFDRVFPHNLKDAPAEKRTRLYPGTPQSMADLFALAKAAVAGEKLGDDAIPDLLVVSISTTDYAGHWWGSDSLEGVDIYRRADIALRDFVRFLDENVGRGQYALAVTADHGGSPLPEQVAAVGVDAGRVHTEAIIRQAHQALEPFGKRPKPPEGERDGHENKNRESRALGFVSPHLFLELSDLSAEKQREALKAVKNAVATVDGVEAVYRVGAFDEDRDAFSALYQKSSVAGRTGAILVRPRPFWVFSGHYRTGIAHGSHLRHDRVVPFFLLGPSVARGRRERTGFARDVAPTLARQLGVPPPAGATGVVLDKSQRRPLP